MEDAASFWLTGDLIMWWSRRAPFPSLHQSGAGCLLVVVSAKLCYGKPLIESPRGIRRQVPVEVVRIMTRKATDEALNE
jgi:hypothetical protein